MQMVYEKRVLRSKGCPAWDPISFVLARTQCKAQNFACVRMAMRHIALIVARIRMLLFNIVACPQGDEELGT